MIITEVGRYFLSEVKIDFFFSPTCDGYMVPNNCDFREKDLKKILFFPLSAEQGTKIFLSLQQPSLIGSPFTSHSEGRAPEYRATVPPKIVRRKYESMCRTWGSVALNLHLGDRTPWHKLQQDTLLKV